MFTQLVYDKCQSLPLYFTKIEGSNIHHYNAPKPLPNVEIGAKLPPFYNMTFWETLIRTVLPSSSEQQIQCIRGRNPWESCTQSNKSMCIFQMLDFQILEIARETNLSVFLWQNLSDGCSSLHRNLYLPLLACVRHQEEARRKLKWIHPFMQKGVSFFLGTRVFEERVQGG